MESYREHETDLFGLKWKHSALATGIDFLLGHNRYAVQREKLRDDRKYSPSIDRHLRPCQPRLCGTCRWVEQGTDTTTIH